jgi:hypothetical protein
MMTISVPRPSVVPSGYLCLPDVLDLLAFMGCAEPDRVLRHRLADGHVVASLLSSTSGHEFQITTVWWRSVAADVAFSLRLVFAPTTQGGGILGTLVFRITLLERGLSGLIVPPGCSGAPIPPKERWIEADGELLRKRMHAVQTAADPNFGRAIKPSIEQQQLALMQRLLREWGRLRKVDDQATAGAKGPLPQELVEAQTIPTLSGGGAHLTAANSLRRQPQPAPPTRNLVAGADKAKAAGLIRSFLTEQVIKLNGVRRPKGRDTYEEEARAELGDEIVKRDLFRSIHAEFPDLKLARGRPREP